MRLRGPEGRHVTLTGPCAMARMLALLEGRGLPRLRREGSIWLSFQKDRLGAEVDQWGALTEVQRARKGREQGGRGGAGECPRGCRQSCRTCPGPGIPSVAGSSWELAPWVGLSRTLQERVGLRLVGWGSRQAPGPGCALQTASRPPSSPDSMDTSMDAG